jgi:uncharacterized protein
VLPVLHKSCFPIPVPSHRHLVRNAGQARGSRTRRDATAHDPARPHRLPDKLPWYAVLLALCVLGAAAQAAPQFPKLTGRVVDAAGVLSADTVQALDASLARHEKETSNQVVVVTLKDLQGYAIEDFGYQLGRHWGIGQAGRDNGALLIVAPGERAVRIEVGYGLEHALTDAVAHNIIQTVILPMFRQGDYDAGVRAGVAAMLAAIGGTYEPLPEKGGGLGRGKDFMSLVIVAIALGEFFAAPFRQRLISSGVLGTLTGLAVGLTMGSLFLGLLAALLVILFHYFIGGGGAGPGMGGRRGYYGGTYGGGGFGGGFGGGGFSGGGGGFGGGGASGRW